MKNQTLSIEPIMVRIEESVVAGLAGQVGIASEKCGNDEAGWRYVVKLKFGNGVYFPPVSFCTVISKEEYYASQQNFLNLTSK